MTWYDELYVGESIVHKTKRVKWKIDHNAGQIGIYVIDQANINSGYRKDDRNVGGAVANDPRFLPEFFDLVAYLR